MPPIALSNVGSQVFPSTSHTTRVSYVPVLHNIPQPNPLVLEPSGHVGYGPIGPTSHPHTSAWAPPKQPNICNQYLSGE